MLTYDQAVYFLDGILRMPPNWRDLLQNKPLEFLTVYLKRHAIRVPFQNMDMAAVKEGHRWFPSEQSLVNTGLSGKGGCCIHLNYFTMLVFRAIGLDTFVVRGDHYCAPVAGTHCLVMVKVHGSKDAGIYMVEVGGAYPMLEPVPMDKERLPYRTLQAGGFPYEFREIAPGWIGKFHLGGGIMGGAFNDKKETLRTCWEMKPRGLWEFDYPMLETFTKPCYSTLLRAPYMYRFFSNPEFQRLFPELPENANCKEKVLVTKPKTLSKVGKVLAATGRPKVVEPKVVPVKNGKESVTNGKTATAESPKANGKPAPATTTVTNGKTGKTPLIEDVAKDAKTKVSGKEPLELTLSKMEIEDSDEDEYEVVTEEEVESDEDDDLEDPKNWIFAYKRRIVVGDAKSRKIVKNYESYEEMAKDLKKYFPKISSKIVDKAVETFSAYEPKPTPYDTIL